MSVSALVPLLVTLPLLGAAIALIAGRHRKTQVAVSVVTLTLVLAIAAVLLVVVDIGNAPIAVRVSACGSGSDISSVDAAAPKNGAMPG